MLPPTSTGSTRRRVLLPMFLSTTEALNPGFDQEPRAAAAPTKLGWKQRCHRAAPWPCVTTTCPQLYPSVPSCSPPARPRNADLSEHTRAAVWRGDLQPALSGAAAERSSPVLSQTCVPGPAPVPAQTFAQGGQAGMTELEASTCWSCH